MAGVAGDTEIDAIRAKRMEELQSDRKSKESEERAQRDEMQNMMLSQILTQDARARLNGIALVKPEKAKSIEANIMRMAQTGQIGEKLTDNQLINLLERFNSQTQSSTKVKFQRRAIDSDEDND